MIIESVKCGRCEKWFKREILEFKEIENQGKLMDIYVQNATKNKEEGIKPVKN